MDSDSRTPFISDRIPPAQKNRSNPAQTVRFEATTQRDVRSHKPCEIIKKLIDQQREFCSDLWKLYNLCNDPRDDHKITPNNCNPPEDITHSQDEIVRRGAKSNILKSTDCTCSAKIAELLSQVCQCSVTSHMKTLLSNSSECTKFEEDKKQKSISDAAWNKPIDKSPECPIYTSTAVWSSINQDSEHTTVKASRPVVETRRSSDKSSISGRNGLTRIEPNKNNLLQGESEPKENVRTLSFMDLRVHDDHPTDYTQGSAERGNNNFYVWTVQNFHQILTQSTGCCSDDFYLGYPGYRFHLQLEFTTNFMGAFIRLVAGNFDNQLQWPLRNEMQFVIIDQTMTGRNLARTMKPLPSDADEHGVWDRPRTSEDVKPTSEAWGIPDFVPRSMLSPGSERLSVYVRNDCIHLAVRLL